jgi:hypothetical protein
MLLVILSLAPVSHRVSAQAPSPIRAGSPALTGVSMPLTTDTVDNYVLTGGVRQPTGSTVRSITMHPDAGEPAYQIQTLHWTSWGDTSVTTMVVRAQDLSLVFHRV